MGVVLIQTRTPPPLCCLLSFLISYLEKKKVCFTDIAVAFCVECQSTLGQQVMTTLLHELEVRFQWEGYWED